MDAPDLWLQFGQIVLAHGLAVASPGPDFALVLRQSLARGRTPALWTSVGIGSGILVHVGYSLLGLGLVLTASPIAFTLLKFAGAAYLAWLGLQALRSARQRSDVGPAELVAAAGAPSTTGSGTPSGAWLTGFLTNVLNPKATLFFVALFPTVVHPQTPKLVQVGYGLWMALATALWFALVSCVFTRDTARRTFVRWSHWIDRLLGLVFLGFAAGLVTASMR